MLDVSKVSKNMVEMVLANRQLFNRRPDRLLSCSRDAKTIKGEKKGYLTGILYLAPADLSGENLCPMAEAAGCKNACLFTAGRAEFFPRINMGRLRKTLLFQQQREWFVNKLVRNINSLKRLASKQGLIPVVRLNGTSDIRWENVQVAGKRNIMEVFPDIQFYDYTKIANRRNLPDNYDLTFSYSGVSARYIAYAATSNLRKAVVFAGDMPKTFLGLPVINGDESDLRFLDPQDCVVGLSAKGKAKKDTSGFVVGTQPINFIRKVV